jgi:hypothetical protein
MCVNNRSSVGSKIQLKRGIQDEKRLVTLSRPRILNKFQPLFGVADADSLNPEPDPTFQVNPGPGSRAKT